MKRLLALLLFFCASPVLAQDRSDQVEYAPNRVYTIVGQPSIQTMIQFSDNEAIENVALGDASAWQVTPNKRANMLFIKPLFARGRTNMTVITNRRRYLFDLVIAGPKARALYAIQFTYAEDEMIAAMLAKQTDTAIAAADGAPTEPVKRELNSEWRFAGDKRLSPARIYDDGDSTYIGWSASTELPGIFVKNEDGKEGPVNFGVRGEYLVVDGVAPSYILRRGKARATLTNMAPRPPKPIAAQPELSGVTP
jgi:type IV secretion system protein VirB9